eukprot:5715287-Amphidinium_carterae.1
MLKTTVTIPQPVPIGHWDAVGHQTLPGSSSMAKDILNGVDQLNQGRTKGKMSALTMIANAKPVQTDTFIPTTADQDNGQHLWWMWLSGP